LATEQDLEKKSEEKILTVELKAIKQSALVELFACPFMLRNDGIHPRDSWACAQATSECVD
jgi:hypothetical protein